MRLGSVKVKDFKPGQTFYVLYINAGTNKEPEIQERTVEKVGRKYVTDNREIRYCCEEYLLKEGLVEASDYGRRGFLFLTKSEAEDYMEKNKLALWIANISFSKARLYSLQQLRDVYEILTPQIVLTKGKGDENGK